MSDDLNTVNANRAKVFGREVEVLRKRYLQHRETLGRLTADAPTEHLAKEYARLQTEIDSAMAKLDELERGGPSEADTIRAAPPAAAPPPRPLTQPASVPSRPITQPSTVPVPPGERRNWQNAPIAATPEPEPSGEGTGLRSILIIAAGVAVLAVIVLLVWYFLSAEKQPAALRDKPEASTATVITETQAPVPPPAVALGAAPSDFNYGTIRKGTRATHQFTLSNGTDAPITIATSRSTCRCLWFKHAASIPPHGTTALTITVDGGRAKKGPIDEQVQVSAKGDAQTATTIHVVATVE